MAPEYLYRFGEPTKSPYQGGGQFAAAVIEAVIELTSPSANTPLSTPEEARLRLPQPSKYKNQSGSDTDEAFWNHALMHQELSHEMRTQIVIAKASKPLPFFIVKEVLARMEREGEREGWLPYGIN